MANENHQSSTYRGRFAPSPTGPLHFGSLICAVASYLQAKSQNGVWLLRMEDLDKDREQAGAAQQILNTLEACGLHWDEDVVYQSQRLPLYDAALDELRSLQLIYPCACSRKDIDAFFASQKLENESSNRYPDICRGGITGDKLARSLRIKTDDRNIQFIDKVQGQFSQSIHKDIGDFVLKRADGFYAYQLAVVVDDAAQGISEIVRGSDLLDNTPRQIFLQRALSLSTLESGPNYLHHPVAINESGEKLSKQTFAAPIDHRQPLPVLRRVLSFLGQTLPGESEIDNLDDFWRWSVQHWQWQKIPKCLSLHAAAE